MASSTYRRAEHVVFDVSEGRATLLNDDGTHLVTLNDIGTSLWLRFDEPRTSHELVAELRSTYPDVGDDVLNADCAAFLDELVANGLLDVVD